MSNHDTVTVTRSPPPIRPITELDPKTFSNSNTSLLDGANHSSEHESNKDKHDRNSDSNTSPTLNDSAQLHRVVSTENVTNSKDDSSLQNRSEHEIRISITRTSSLDSQLSGQPSSDTQTLLLNPSMQQIPKRQATDEPRGSLPMTIPQQKFGRAVSEDAKDKHLKKEKKSHKDRKHSSDTSTSNVSGTTGMSPKSKLLNGKSEDIVSSPPKRGLFGSLFKKSKDSADTGSRNNSDGDRRNSDEVRASSGDENKDKKSITSKFKEMFGKRRGSKDEEVTSGLAEYQKDDVVLEAENFEQLPAEIQKHVKNAKIDMEKISDPFIFECLLNILHFQLKVKFKSIEEKKRVLKNDTSKLNIPPPKTLSPRPCYDMKQLITEGDPRELFKLEKEEGKGGFGVVYQALRRDTKKKVAVKVMHHTSEKERKFNAAELCFLSFCQHPNIVKYFCSYKYNDDIWSILEFLEGGTLDQAVKAYMFQEKQIAYVAREMLQGIAYLHSENLVHRDLKSSNVMMSIKGEIKLIDFGLCVDMSDQLKKTSIVGSPLYIPPEMIRREPHDFKVDIWSLGICLMELANGHPPHQKSSIRAMFTASTEGYPDPLEKPKSWSSSFKDFLSHCLQLDPGKRLSADELLKHEFLRSADTAKSMQQILTGIFILQQVMPF